MSQHKLILQAKQGDPAAIAQLIPFWLLSPTATVQVTLEQECLNIVLRSHWALDKASVIKQIEPNLQRLSPANVRLLQIYGQQHGCDEYSWSATVDLVSLGITKQADEPTNPPSDVTLPQRTENTVKNNSLTDTVERLTHPASSSGGCVEQSHPPLVSQTTVEPRDRSSRDLGLLFLARVEPVKIGFVSLLASHLIFGASDYSVSGFLQGSDRLMMFLHNVNLIFHEAGHVFFAIGGQFIGILGGSLMQILVPLIISIHFLMTRQRYSWAIALWWVGQNFMDVSIYIKDARAQILPLLGGEASTHDWHYLLQQLNWLGYDIFLGNIVLCIGIVLCLSALAAAAYFSQSFTKRFA